MTKKVIRISRGPASQGFSLRVGPFAVCVQAARVADLKRQVVTDVEVDPPSLAPATPQEQYEADRADAGRRRR